MTIVNFTCPIDIPESNLKEGVPMFRERILDRVQFVTNRLWGGRSLGVRVEDPELVKRQKELDDKLDYFRWDMGEISL